MNYATRNNAFTVPVTWVLDGATLRREDNDGPPQVVPLGDIAQVNLSFAPTRVERNRFRCRLTLRNGTLIEFFNRRYRGFNDFVDTSADYAAFVRALHTGLGHHAPACIYQSGASRGAYAANLAIFGFVAAVLVGALAFFLMVGLVFIAVVKVLLIMFYAPAALRWVRRNRPQTYSSAAIPPALLPDGAPQ